RLHMPNILPTPISLPPDSKPGRYSGRGTSIGNKRERAREQRWEHVRAGVRAKVEHPFRVIKRQFGYTKVRYRGLAKNTAQVLTSFTLSNLWMKRKQLLPAMGNVRL
ncbi:transposase, partial [Xanthomonas arboricola]|uniref:transposase n=1 Tax=Xanthomonas arboricola TaxID=56448 RepID=UPI0021588FDC